MRILTRRWTNRILRHPRSERSPFRPSQKSKNISYQNYLLNVDKFQSDPALPTKLNLTWQDSTQSL